MSAISWHVLHARKKNCGKYPDSPKPVRSACVENPKTEAAFPQKLRDDTKKVLQTSDSRTHKLENKYNTFCLNAELENKLGKKIKIIKITQIHSFYTLCNLCNVFMADFYKRQFFEATESQKSCK